MCHTCASLASQTVDIVGRGLRLNVEFIMGQKLTLHEDTDSERTLLLRLNTYGARQNSEASPESVETNKDVETYASPLESQKASFRSWLRKLFKRSEKDDSGESQKDILRKEENAQLWLENAKLRQENDRLRRLKEDIVIQNSRENAQLLEENEVAKKENCRLREVNESLRKEGETMKRKGEVYRTDATKVLDADGVTEDSLGALSGDARSVPLPRRDKTRLADQYDKTNSSHEEAESLEQKVCLSVAPEEKFLKKSGFASREETYSFRSKYDQEETSLSNLATQDFSLEHTVESKADKLLPIGSETESIHRFTYITPVQTLIGDCPGDSDQFIIEVSELLDQEEDTGGDWRQLWPQLLHKSPNEALIRQQTEGPTLFLLKTWCQIKPHSTATVGELVNILSTVNRPDIVVIIQNYCQPEGISASVSLNSWQWKMESDGEDLIQLHFGRNKRVTVLKTSYERQVVGEQGYLLGSVSNKWIFCIPPGALNYEQEVAVSFYHVTNSVGLGGTEFVTGIIEITPHQLNFSKPVELLLRHDLYIGDDSSKVTVLYHSGERDCETMSSLCQLSSMDRSTLSSDIKATLWDDFVHIETSHICSFGVNCEGKSCIEVWASLFAPECPQSHQFKVRVSLTSHAPQIDDEDAKTMQSYGLVRNNQHQLILRCNQQEQLQIDVEIPHNAKGWTVFGHCYAHKIFSYSDIKGGVFLKNPWSTTTEFWFSKERSSVDVTKFAPVFKFNGCCCILNPPIMSAEPLKSSSGITMSGAGEKHTTISGFYTEKDAPVAFDPKVRVDVPQPEKYQMTDEHHHNHRQPYDQMRNCPPTFQFNGYPCHWNSATSCPKLSKPSNAFSSKVNSIRATSLCTENAGHSVQSEDSVDPSYHMLWPQPEGMPDNDQNDCQTFDRPISASDIESISECEQITRNWLQMGWLMLKDSGYTMDQINNHILKHYIDAPNSMKVIILIEEWRRLRGVEATVRALIDICCHKLVDGVRDIIVDSLKCGCGHHHDNEEFLSSTATPDLDPDRVIKAVTKAGCADALSIGLELGLSFAQIQADTATLPNEVAKLQTIIQIKIRDIGKAATARKLLEVCKTLPRSIHGEVMDQLKRMA